MKRIVQLAVVALACSAGSAWSQQEQVPQAMERTEAPISVAQASGAQQPTVSREEAAPRKVSLHEMSGLASDGVYPSRGGPQDD
jgi:hypothetical protein